MKLAAILLIVLGSFILGVSPVAGDQTPIDIGTQKQLFIDDTIIDTSERIAKTQHQFIPHPDNPLVVRQEPWERAEFVYGTVIRDPDTHQFRMWCTNAGSRPHTEHDRDFHIHLWYATSADGLHWVRPRIGLVNIDGSKSNNLVASTIEHTLLRGASVVYNANEKNPARRYIHLVALPDRTTGPSYSADGIHWSLPETGVMVASDAATLSYDPRQDRFFGSSVSMPEVRGFVRRSIEMMATDLETWKGARPGEPAESSEEGFKTILIADEIDDAGVATRVDRLRSILDYDNPDHYHAQLHHMVAFPYDSLTLGIVTLWDNVWYTDNKPLYAGGRDRALVHTQLTWSKDPDWMDWHRMEQRQPLIEPTEAGKWDCAARFPFAAPIRVEDELWLYYCGWGSLFNAPRMYGAGGIRAKKDERSGDWIDRFVHIPTGEKLPPHGIGLATMRLDGFVSLDAGAQGGTITTKPIVFRGNQLVLNARAMGHMTIEILDAAGTPIEGLGRPAVTGDSVRFKLASEKLADLAGTAIRLRFHLWNTQLYSFGFE